LNNNAIFEHNRLKPMCHSSTRPGMSLHVA